MLVECVADGLMNGGWQSERTGSVKERRSCERMNVSGVMMGEGAMLNAH